MHTKKRILSIRILQLLLILASAQACSKPKKVKPAPAARPVKMLTLKKSCDTIEYSFPATVLAKERADLSFRISGVLVEFPCFKGKIVKKGEIIGKLDPDDAQNKYNSAVAAYSEAETIYKKTKKAYDKEITSEMDFEKSLRALERAESEMKIAKRALDDTELKAPFNGVIVNEYVENYQEIKPKQMVAKLANLSSFNVQFDIPETLINSINKKNHCEKFKAWVVFPRVSDKRKFPLTVNSGVAETVLEADPQTQTFRILGVMKAPKDIVILPGMGADVIIATPNPKVIPENSILVPISAIVADNDNDSFVWIVDKKTMTVSKRRIKLGDAVNCSKIVVLRGLTAGETIVTTGASSLYPGMKVKKLVQIGGEKIEQPK